ncbi:protein tincar [Plakobranchus ocellatus]|uniref:Protein tincar n=1 Tax=Plakobranchus ocellatus TaxID=259542 RepID=A0AAV3Z9M7_9GAST|nr:protein tincar [Plakobranchus ocellatus]
MYVGRRGLRYCLHWEKVEASGHAREHIMLRLCPGEAWRSDIDFLYPAERAYYSEIRSSVNASRVNNASHVHVDTHHVPVIWGDRAFDVHVSIAFANFCFALGSFLVRYASVFWYTNKPLTVVFALQLLAMVLNSIFSFSSFSTLYCVSCNHRLYLNVSLSLRCGAVLVLYLVGSTVLLASTVTVFEYGCHYFHEKFEIVSRHRETESYIKRTVIANNGCQGYVPHVCAMTALVLSAVCKGPLLYDLVSLMRLTGDDMLLSGIVCEVCYMILWLALWLGLTLKQQWQFRILDYVALRPPPSSVVSEDSLRSNHLDRGDGVMTDSLTRNKRLSGRENFPQRFLEPVATGTNSSCEEPCPSDLGTDESDGITSAAEMVLDLDGNPIPDRNSNFRRSRNRRAGGQRVTFDESVRSKGSAESANQQSVNIGHAEQAGVTGAIRPEDMNQLNVTADVHSSGATSSDTSNESSHGVIVRPKPANGGDSGGLSREYRNSIRNKCGELYSSANNLSSSFEETTEEVSPPEPLPTLMSSFRDKVRESSLAASTFKERERHMLEQFDYLDPHPPPVAVLEDITHTEADKRRCIVVTDHVDVENTNSLDRHVRDTPKYTSEHDHSYTDSHANGRYRPRSKSYDQSKHGPANVRVENSLSGKPYDFKKTLNTSSLPRGKAAAHNSSVSSDEGHRSSFSNSTHESSDLSLSIPPAMEDIQRGRMRIGSGLDRRSLKDDHFFHQHQQPQQQQHQQHQHLQHPLHSTMVGGMKDHLVLNPRPLQVMMGDKAEIKRRDSANYSLTSSQETSSNESDQGHGLCSQV